MAVEKLAEGVPLWEELVDTLFPGNYPAVAHVARELRRLHPEGRRQLLDVASPRRLDAAQITPAPDG